MSVVLIAVVILALAGATALYGWAIEQDRRGEQTARRTLAHRKRGAA